MFSNYIQYIPETEWNEIRNQYRNMGNKQIYGSKQLMSKWPVS